MNRLSLKVYKEVVGKKNRANWIFAPVVLLKEDNVLSVWNSYVLSEQKKTRDSKLLIASTRDS